MPNANTPTFKDVLLASTLTDPTDFQVVTMVNSNLGNNTFTSANGALRSPNWPGVWPSPNNLVTYTVFQGIPGVYRIITGTINTESGFDHIRFMDGNGLLGPMLLDSTSSASNVNTPITFVSGVGQTFTVSARGDNIGTGSGWSLDVRGYRAVALSPGQITAEGGTLRAADATGTFTLRRATRGAANVQVFTSNGTWTKPAGVNAVRVFLVGGGGGGGSGRRGLGSTLRTGGGGGGPGAVVSYTTMPASVFAATESVVVGSGGAGGAGQTTNSTDGIVGTAGGQSSFSSGATLIRAAGGGGGGGGGSVSAGTGGTAATGDFATGNAGGTGATLSSAPTAPTVPSFNIPTGGGGGGAITTGNVAGAGASSSQNTTVNVINGWINAGVTSATFSAGFSAQSNSANGGIAAFPNRPRGGGGGGGGASNTTFTISGAGGVGGWYGAGGGGGAASVDGVTSGAGGQGGPGIVVVVSW